MKNRRDPSFAINTLWCHFKLIYDIQEPLALGQKTSGSASASLLGADLIKEEHTTLQALLSKKFTFF